MASHTTRHRLKDVTALKASEGMHTWAVKAGGHVYVVTVIGGEPAAPRVTGGNVQVAGRTLSFDGSRLSGE